MKSKLLKGIVTAFALTTLIGGSASSVLANGKSLYTAKACSSCHGAEGKAPIMAQYPKLAGQNSAYLVQQMKDIKSGARGNGMSMVMKGIITNVSDSEMKQIADYLAKVK
ncbi:MAG: cytochrome c [bacterium]|jgi:cytochrome c